MRLIVGLLLSSFVDVSAPAAQQRPQAEVDYGIGALVGDCGPSRCRAVTGWLESDAPKPGDVAAIRLVSQLLGPPIGADAVLIPYPDPLKSVRGGRRPRVPDLAWSAVSPARGTLLTLVLATEEFDGVLPGEAMLVTPDRRAADVIRSIANDALYLGGSAAGAPYLLSTLATAAFPEARAGYLYKRVTGDWAAMLSADDSWDAISQLIASHHVPVGVWLSMIHYAVLNYYRFSENGRESAVRQLTGIAQGDDLQAALLGLDGLVRLSEAVNAVSVTVPVGRRARLLDAYRDLSARGEIPVNSGVETLLTGRSK
jgi:hypothetical protein